MKSAIALLVLCSSLVASAAVKKETQVIFFIPIEDAPGSTRVVSTLAAPADASTLGEAICYKGDVKDVATIIGAMIDLNNADTLNIPYTLLPTYSFDFDKSSVGEPAEVVNLQYTYQVDKDIYTYTYAQVRPCNRKSK